ncbi:LD-carboxypeptidase [Vagococcus sp. BWB3-3]|uniref:LD-carboxypeptidase n=1 Tax=Vagococcus allomyrinae TaxID=2794353 RepID=A0A940P2W0_9ENTE|nr:S66 peptidase family protein [Vagococcus allomyrinae]MBP1040474.1 LD-carboxypeptidase [Vagococcus allomyrinae]
MKIPEKLKHGDEIRIIAPSRSLKILADDGVILARQRLEAFGFKVTFGKHVETCDLQHSSPIAERVADIHEAFADPNVKGILTVIGGFNSNELLPYLDYQLIQANPKVLCGYSDITALANAITAKCQFVTYSGPHFSSFQMTELQSYQSTHFKQCLCQEEPFDLVPSRYWSDDKWFINQEKRNYHQTDWKVYQHGTALGTLVGGNLCTLNLLQGTEFMPTVDQSILFIEDDELTIPETFARDLASLLQVTKEIKGLLIGRFQETSEMTEEQLHFILDKHPVLKTIPVYYDLDFGHTQPMMTLPIGGMISLNTQLAHLKLIEF